MKTVWRIVQYWLRPVQPLSNRSGHATLDAELDRARDDRFAWEVDE